MKNLLAILIALLTVPLSAEEPRDVFNDIEAIIETVLDHHYQPPTRQQMVLAFVRDIVPNVSTAGLSRSLSDISSREELYAFMRERLRYKQAEAENCLADPTHCRVINETIPGGVVLEKTKTFEINQSVIANRYVGIGVQSTMRDDKFVFSRITDGGTAAQAGIKAGDILLEVDGHNIAGMKLEEIIDRLRGPEGSKVVVVVQTEQEPHRTLELARRKVRLTSLDLMPIEHEAPEATIVMRALNSSTIADLEDILDTLPASVKTLVIVMPYSHDIHLNVLLFDALSDQALLGRLVTRNATRDLLTDPGTILDNRNITLQLSSQSMLSPLTRQFISCCRLNVAGTLSDGPGTEAFQYEAFALPGSELSVQLATGIVVPVQ